MAHEGVQDRHSELQNYVTKGDFDAGAGCARSTQLDDGEKAQVELQNKVNALEGAVGDHKLLFTHQQQCPFLEFNLKNMEMAMVNTISTATFISISEQDLDGNAIRSRQDSGR